LAGGLQSLRSSTWIRDRDRQQGSWLADRSAACCDHCSVGHSSVGDV